LELYGQSRHCLAMEYLDSGAFVGKPVDQLSDEERIAYYRNLSVNALQKAQAASTNEHRAAFLDIARSWAAIARDVEKLMSHEAERWRLLNQHTGKENIQRH
jgi:hypothetical protein